MFLRILYGGQEILEGGTLEEKELDTRHKIKSMA